MPLYSQPPRIVRLLLTSQARRCLPQRRNLSGICHPCASARCGCCRNGLTTPASSPCFVRRESLLSHRTFSSSSEQTLPPTSSLYDPRTNEPAGLRQVLDGLKRMEVQVTNIENDLDSVKNIVKKIRESNGLTERRLDKIEDFADTMQQDLYLAMDMVRSLTDVLSESKTPSSAATVKPMKEREP